MRIAILSDTHGNPIALDAVLDDARSQGVDAFWFLGDLVAIGYGPVEVLERLSQLDNATFVRGNTDRYVVTGKGSPPAPGRGDAKARPGPVENVEEAAASFAWTRGFITAHGWYEWLAGLPIEHRASLPDGTRALLAHASPGNDDGEGIHPAMGNAQIESLLDGSGPELTCLGHTHEPMYRELGRGRFINPGCVSNPRAPDLRASYAVLDATSSGYTVQHRRVSYDHQAVIEEIRRSHHPAADLIIGFQLGRHPARTPHQDHVDPSTR